MSKNLWIFAVAGSLLCWQGASFASGGGSMGMGSMESAPRATPAELAKDHYNSGVRSIAKAKDLEDDALKAATPEKKQKLLDKAAKAYRKAADEFKAAVDNNAGMYQAWNYLGFAQRHLGAYDAALAAYARALELNPTYPEAIEYRGEALLGVNRIEDAKSAYMTLFSSSRALADELMTAMHRWIEARQADPKNVSAEDLAGFSQWVDERSNVARQTASLAVDGPITHWK